MEDAMKARDVMTSNVITVSPDAPVGQIASLLLQHRISALPVTDYDRHVLGIISEGDLMRRPESGTERARSWWLEALTDSETLAHDYTKAHGRRAEDVMTRHVVSVREDTDVADIAHLLESHRIKRVPVVRDGKLVGIVSRADLLRSLIAAGDSRTAQGRSTDDRTLHDDILKRMRAEPWTKAAMVNIVAHGGEVELWGLVPSDQQRDALRVLVEGVAGVRGVQDHLNVMPRVTYAD
jgi:CBS domain-containing protein